ncbi:TolC family outer membrane protein [Sphingosinicella sp. LHD-64]|uniref:TolC family outer membrane protein n=1 Tax=Sphingosinicella sp. LHD-64 TaxID=3072139 RepID=UPI00280ED546|nr:TolC family outer membrane protein [Sphingosinicella sp. LHD-64]MDQ8754881.1 TolC family outer membrane protein [Sphingosinicella sp. LHD-64]
MRGRLLAAAGVAALVWSGAALAQQQAAPAQMPATLPPAAPAPGPAMTLRDALVRTYASNPTLMAQRQTLRGLDEGVALARARGRPQVNGDAAFNQDVITRNLGENQRNFNVGGDVRVPLFAGGTIRNAVRAANTRVEAGRADLRATEGDIFTEAVAAYMDVIRDRSIVQLNQNQVRVLETNLQANRDRFEVGDLTRTDVAQSEARLALARSNLAIAEGTLETSEENYERVIGVAPGDLQPPPPLPSLPGAPGQAMEVALANNADLASIAAQARAAGFDVRAARGERLPLISGVSSIRYSDSLGTNNINVGGGGGLVPENTTSAGVGLTLSVPLYQGGAAGARVRQAQAQRGQLLEQAIGVERLVIANARASYARYVAANDAIESNTIAVAANELALEGTRAEQTVGTRNVLDVLNAEQELLNSQVALVTARRDAYVAGFDLLNSMGQAEAEDLNLEDGPLYDPTVNYNRYSGSWNDWDDGPMIRPVATRTAPETANSPVTELPR